MAPFGVHRSQCRRRSPSASADHQAMPIKPPEYTQAVDALSPVLSGFSGRVIAIDGRDGAGKSTLGRFLAWWFNVTLLETDLFLSEGPGITHRYEEIDRIIAQRLRKPRPVIVEGITVLRTLDRIGRKPDFLLYVRNREFDGSDRLSGLLGEYESEYEPEDGADLIVDLVHEDDVPSENWGALAKVTPKRDR